MMNPWEPTPMGWPLFGATTFEKCEDIKAAAVFGVSFPPTGWDPTTLAWAVATEFATVSGWQTGDFNIDPGKPDDSPEKLTCEIKELLSYFKKDVDEDNVVPRSRYQEEALVQAVNFLPYFYAATGSTGSTRPATRQLIVAAHFVAGSVSAFFKLKYKRARPAQVFPWLFPRLQVPGHASYPSGHALQATLVALALAKVVPGPVAEVCARLAARIGTNRERAGLHWPSDTAVGKGMAPKVLLALAKVPSFCLIADQAATEWNAKPPYSVPKEHV
jgi:acid phosphatase (class A)